MPEESGFVFFNLRFQDGFCWFYLNSSGSEKYPWNYIAPEFNFKDFESN